jgi:polyphenol oxidase
MFERRTFRGGLAVLVPTHLEGAGFLVAFSERTGGISADAFASLNLGLRAGDAIGNARENRRLLCAALGIGSFAVGRQVHGARFARVGPKRAGSGFTDPATAFAATDILTTASAGVPVGILTADCVPVALADPRAGRLAVVHAGWRGVAAGVIGAALGLFPDPARVMAAVGPSIGSDHYEVGADVAGLVGSASERGPIVRGRGPQLWLDLPGTVVRILEERGVRSVEADGDCTACRPDRFFSYRRDGVTGRQGVVAVRLE